MNCERFLEVLADAGPAPLPAAAHAHAALCATCAAELRAALELDIALAGVTDVRAPRDFADSVMARVAVERAAAPPAVLAEASQAPLWLRVCADPAVVLAAVLAAGIAFAWPWLGTLAGALDARAIPRGLTSAAGLATLAAALLTAAALAVALRRPAGPARLSR